MIFLKIAFHGRRQTELVDAVVGRVTHNRCATQLLEREHVVSVQRRCQHGLEEHHGGRVLVMLHEASDRRGGVHWRVVRVKAELLIPLLNSGVQGAAVFAEWDWEQVVVLCGVAKQEGALWFAVEQALGLISVHLAPVVAAGCDFLEVRHQEVTVVVLRVELGHLAVHQRDDGALCDAQLLQLVLVLLALHARFLAALLLCGFRSREHHRRWRRRRRRVALGERRQLDALLDLESSLYSSVLVWVVLIAVRRIVSAKSTKTTN